MARPDRRPGYRFRDTALGVVLEIGAVLCLVLVGWLLALAAGGGQL